MSRQGKSTPLYGLWLFIGIAIMLFMNLGSYGLFDVDEAIFAEASREMQESRDYVTPTYNGNPRYHKPPMIYWIQSASMDVLGVNPFAARLPSAILGFLALFMFWDFLKKWTKDNRYALMATAVYGFCLSFMMISRAAIADMLLNFLILALIFAILGNLFALERSNKRVFFAGIIMGLGLLAKGPVAVVVAGLVVAFVVFTRRDVWYALKCANPFLLLLGALIVVTPWLGLIVWQKGFGFLHEFIMVHNIGRFTAPMDRHGGEWWYYVAVLLVGFFPWALFLPSAAWGVLKERLPMLKSENPRDILPVAGLFWGVAVVVLFSFSATKLPHYILPALPGFALVVADRLCRLDKERLSLFSAALVFLLALPVLFVFGILHWLPDVLLQKGWLYSQIIQFKPELATNWPELEMQVRAVLDQPLTFEFMPFIIAVLFGLGLVIGLILMRHGYVEGAGFLVATAWAAMFVFAVGFAPRVYEFTQKPLAEFSEGVRQVFRPQDELLLMSLHHPSVTFITGQSFVSVPSPEYLEGLVDTWSSEPVGASRKFMFTDLERVNDYLAVLPERAEYECKGGYCLIVLK